MVPRNQDKKEARQLQQAQVHLAQPRPALTTRQDVQSAKPGACNANNRATAAACCCCRQLQALC
jgi:hypothetical protein